MESAPRKRLYTFITVLVSLTVIIGVGEVAVRLFVESGGIAPGALRKQSLVYEPAIFARHVFKAEAKTIINTKKKKRGLVWEINEHGYRGPSFEIEKPEGTIRVIVYGGSSVFDIRTKRGQDWPRRIERALRHEGFPRVEVINAGIPGHTSIESVGRLLTEGWVFDPDYVLLYNTWNDVKYFRSDKTMLRTIQGGIDPFDPRIHYYNGLDRWLCELSEFYTVLRRSIYKGQKKLTRRGRDTRLAASALNPNAFRQFRLAVEAFVDVARNVGAKPILMTQARLPHPDNTTEDREMIEYAKVGLNHEAILETLDRMDAIIREAAASRGARLIDASQALSGESWAFSDQVHLTPKGSEALAALAARELGPLLASRDPGLSPSAPAAVGLGGAARRQESESGP